MHKAIKSLFIIIFILIPVYGFAFDFTELKNCHAIGIKTLTKSEPQCGTSHQQIYGTKELVNIFGVSDKRNISVTWKYISDTEFLTDNKTISWYRKPSSDTYMLYYQKNSVMNIANGGDIFILCKKTDNNYLLEILKKDSKYEKELFKFLNIQTADLAQEQKKRGIWARIWGKNKNNSKTDFSSQLTNQIITEKSWMRIYFTPGPDCENNIIASINDADARIDVAVYSITNDKIVDALLRAHRRGVRVRVISDRLQSHGKHSLIGRIEDAGIRVVLNKKHKIMHNKFAIFDARHIETGSYNWTNSATDSNAENCMFFPEQDKKFTVEFQHLWGLYTK